MLTFLKDNSNNIVKLAVNQIAMTIFGLLLSAATFSNDTLKLVTGIISILFYFYLLYTAAWDIGARDKIKIDGGRMKKSKFKGFYLGLFANSVNFLLLFISITCFYLANHLELQWAANTTAISGLIAWLINGMYIAVISFANVETFNFELLKLYLLLIAVLSSVALTQFGYTSGVKNYRIFDFSGINNKKSK